MEPDAQARWIDGGADQFPVEDTRAAIVTRPTPGGRAIYDTMIVVAALTLLAWVGCVGFDERPEMAGVELLLAINGILALAGLVVAMRRRYPILMTAFYFDFIFFAVAPLQQIGARFDPIFSYEDDLDAAIVACVAFTVLGLVALAACGAPLRTARREAGFMGRSIYGRGVYPLVLWTVVMASIGVLIAFFGPLLLSTRGEISLFVISTLDKSGSLLLTSFLSPLILIGAVIGLKGALVNREPTWIVGFLVLMALATFLTLNPTLLPRFRASALALFALLAFAGWNSTRLMMLFLASGIAISPLLNAFRAATSFESTTRPFDRFFAHIDFDAFSMIVHVIHYVHQVGFSYGTNILSGLFFFVPRAIWSGKSEHVGSFLFPQLRYYRDVWTDNVSSPPPAEGYFAFGMIGAVLFSLAVWSSFVVLERAARAAERNSPLQFMAALTPMYAIMILRGPFIVGFSEIWGNYAALFAALALLHIRVRVAPAAGREAPAVNGE